MVSCWSYTACLESGFQVAQATRLCRPATRRTERKQRFEVMRTAFSERGSLPFRSSGRRPGQASRPRHPFSKHAHRLSEVRVTGGEFPGGDSGLDEYELAEATTHIQAASVRLARRYGAGRYRGCAEARGREARGDWLRVCAKTKSDFRAEF